jgi:NADH:ubiquinone oxidoreductase subunit 5 (subunit L)/multisubunit Na+/H+ antiporter MnhA subunit
LLWGLSGIGEIFITVRLGVINPIEMSFMLDPCGIRFALVVSLISGRVIIFSCYYIEGETHKRRFGLLILLFVLAMYTLVMSGNIVSLIVG